jgi:hypothetical protein
MKKILLKTILLLCILILSGCTTQETTEKKVRPEDLFSTAWVCAKYEVLDKLKTPSVAEFQSYPDANINITNGYYYVNSYVDSQNSFGAMIRTNFICKITNPKNGTGYCDTVVCTFEKK